MMLVAEMARIFSPINTPAMTDQNPYSACRFRDDIPHSRSDQEAIAELHEQIADLKAVVEQLRRTQHKLEMDRDALQGENMRLRREMTLAHLVEGLDASIGEVVEEDRRVTVPPPARQLYDRLPSTVLFPAFFRIADQEGLEGAQARRYLVRYLADGRLVQSGSYLKKAEAPNSPRTA